MCIFLSFAFFFFLARDYVYSFSLLDNNNSDGIDCLYHNLLICSADRHLGCFEFVVIVSDTTVNILVCVSWHA